jgi:hypothetical protein
MLEELKWLMQGRRFFFIAGAEGSGTTLLLRLLSSPPHCCSLGGNFLKIPDVQEARELATQFIQNNNAAWDTSLSFAEHDAAVRQFGATLAEILRSPHFSGQTHFFFKRSFPFATPKGRFTPDLWDLENLLPGTRYIAIYREPRAACFSALRRGFDTDLRRLAVMCSAQLTALAAQMRALDGARRRVIAYQQLCEQPLQVLGDLARFCELSPESLGAAIDTERIERSLNQQFLKALSPAMLASLEGFFDARRRRQWSDLERMMEP